MVCAALFPCLPTIIIARVSTEIDVIKRDIPDGVKCRSLAPSLPASLSRPSAGKIEVMRYIIHGFLRRRGLHVCLCGRVQILRMDGSATLNGTLRDPRKLITPVAWYV